jgi:hypothetical protein
MTFSSDQPGLSGQPFQATSGYCTACGAAYESAQMYCGRCGRRIEMTAGEGPAAASAGPSYSPPPWHAAGPAGGDVPYGGGATFGAVVLTLFAPVIALIVALVLRSSEQRPTRRQFLKNWAIWSAVWTCTGFLIPIVALGVHGAAASGCQGGIDQTVPPSYQSSDGVHWTATYTCMNGGTETVPVPASQVPGGGS